MLSEHPECEFILTAGDNTNCGQTDVQWTGMLEGFRGVAESMPVMFCMGNHDDMGFEDYFTFTGKYYNRKTFAGRGFCEIHYYSKNACDDY